MWIQKNYVIIVKNFSVWAIELFSYLWWTVEKGERFQHWPQDWTSAASVTMQ